LKINLLDAGLLPEMGRMEQSQEAAIMTIGQFAIHQQQ